jgi:hypothetical protein
MGCSFLFLGFLLDGVTKISFSINKAAQATKHVNKKLHKQHGDGFPKSGQCEYRICCQSGKYSKIFVFIIFHGLQRLTEIRE